MGKPSRVFLGRDVDVSSIVGQARQFVVAMQRCLPSGLPDGVWEGPSVPGVVCGAFAVELWLKALHCIAYPDTKVPRGHDLLHLFGLLPEGLRDRVVNACVSYSPQSFARSLATDSQGFETWRYAYEHGMGEVAPVTALEADVRLLVELSSACEAVYGQLYADNGGKFAAGRCG